MPKSVPKIGIAYPKISGAMISEPNPPHLLRRIAVPVLILAVLGHRLFAGRTQDVRHGIGHVSAALIAHDVQNPAGEAGSLSESLPCSSLV